MNSCFSAARRRTRRTTATLGCVLPLVLVVAACEGNPADTRHERVPPRLVVLAGAGVTDTVQTEPVQALVIQVQDSFARAPAGVPVTFEVAPPTDSARRSERTLEVCRLSAIHCKLSDGSATDTTDAAGQAMVLVRFGTVAGPAWVRVTVPSLGIADSVAYTVLPGRADSIRLGIADSTVYVGNGYGIGAKVLDRVGNWRSGDPIVYGAFGAAASVDSSGRFQGLAIGRAGAVVRSGTLTDTAWVTVPPRDAIAAWYVPPYPYTTPAGVVTVNLDGSGYRLLARGPDLYYDMWPDWLPGGRAIVYQYAPDGRLYAVDTLGVPRRVTPDSTTADTAECYPATGQDGSVFFSAHGGGDFALSLWRAPAVGGEPVRVGPNPANGANNWEASPSPDGQRLAFVSVNGGGLSILDVATGTSTFLHLPAAMPRWSPVSDWIVYNGGGPLYLVHPDGSGLRRAGGGLSFSGRADWSPDGAWLIAKEGTRLVLVNVATDAILPLAWSGAFLEPAWRK